MTSNNISSANGRAQIEEKNNEKTKPSSYLQAHQRKYENPEKANKMKGYFEGRLRRF